jgi:threonine/homoserine efflux transporter RhtA
MHTHNPSNKNIQPCNKPWVKILGIALVAFSYVLYAGILLVPFTSFTVGTKGIICTVLFVLKEIFFWLGVIILGKAFIMKYFKYLNFLHWNHKKHDCCKQSE